MSTTLCCVAVERSRAPRSAARRLASRCRRRTGGVGGGRRSERDRGTIATRGSACSCSLRRQRGGKSRDAGDGAFGTASAIMWPAQAIHDSCTPASTLPSKWTCTSPPTRAATACWAPPFVCLAARSQVRLGDPRIDVATAPAGTPGGSGAPQQRESLGHWAPNHCPGVLERAAPSAIVFDRPGGGTPRPATRVSWTSGMRRRLPTSEHPPSLHPNRTQPPPWFSARPLRASQRPLITRAERPRPEPTHAPNPNQPTPKHNGGM